MVFDDEALKSLVIMACFLLAFCLKFVEGNVFGLLSSQRHKQNSEP